MTNLMKTRVWRSRAKVQVGQPQELVGNKKEKRKEEEWQELEEDDPNINHGRMLETPTSQTVTKHDNW